MIGHVDWTKIQSSKPLVTSPPPLYTLPGSDVISRHCAAEGETKYEQLMTQKNSEANRGTAARLPHTNAAAWSEQSAMLCAVPLSCTLWGQRMRYACATRPGLFADLGGLVCGLHSSDAALTVPSTSLSTSSATSVRAGAWVRRVVAVGEGSGGCERESRGSQRHGTSGETGCAVGGGGGGGGGRSEGYAKP